MATKEEETQKDTWWLNELESLGLSPKVKNDQMTFRKRAIWLKNLKQASYQAYKEAYNEVN